MAAGARDVLQRLPRARVLRRDPARLLDQREAVPDLRTGDPRPGDGGRPGPHRAQPLAAARAAGRGRLHRRLPRHPDDPAGGPPRVRHAGVAAAGHPQQRAVLVRRGAGPVLRRLRRRGVPRRHRLDPPIAGLQCLGARAQPRPDHAVRRGAAGRTPRRPAAAQRLRLAPEGHRAGRRGGGVRRRVRGPRLRQLQLQLHAAGRGRRLLRGDDGPAGQVLRLASAALAGARAGGRRCDRACSS